MTTLIKTPFNSMTSIFAVGLLVLSCAASGGGALAAEVPQPLTKIVHYGDLNLESELGAKELYARLRGAAKQVCRPFDSAETARQRLWKSCLNDAVANAVTAVNNAALSALHVRFVNQSKS
jgi:UrcA family protein